VPVGFDFRTVGNLETDGTEELLDAIEADRHRMQATARNAAAGQRDVQCLGRQLCLKLGVLQRIAP
jgi:hypothetical protein